MSVKVFVNTNIKMNSYNFTDEKIEVQSKVLTQEHAVS